MNLKPLYEEAHQFNYYNGTLLSDGKVEVWYLNRTRYADIYADVGGETPLPNPIELNNLGMQPVYVNPAFNYTIVVKDVYGNELYSIDKYMQAEGEHNMTNVVVQPSETVGVSAWTEGEVQIYQPYLSGDIGKTYSGIDPIVVNNDENKISAETVSFGVQEPLFFVKDDEEGCIIGCSGVDSGASVVYQPYGSDAISGNLYMQQSRYPHKTEIMVSASGETKVVGIAPPVPSQASSTRLLVADSGSLPDVRWAEIGDIVPQPGQDYLPVSSFDDYSGQVSGQIDYVSANAGKTYSAGANIDITDQVISVTGLQPSGDYATKDDLESGLSGKMDKSESANFYPMEGNPSGFLTVETDWTDTITAASSYAYEQATAAIPAPQDLSYISGQVDSKLPTSAFSTVSGDFITALPADMATTGDIADLAESISETYQPKGDYLTTGDSANFYTTANPSGFITGVPDELDVNNLTADQIIVTALVNPGDSEYYGVVINPGDIGITDRDGNTESINTTAISDWNGVVNTVSSNSAAWAEGGVDSATVSAIASDYAESAISSVSGNYYPMNSNPSGYLTGIPAQLVVDELIAYTGITSEGRISAPSVDAKEAVIPGDSEFYGVSLSTNGVEITDNELNTETITYNSITGWNSTMDTVSSNSATWAGIDSATVSAIASDYAESAASGKLDTTAFNSAEFYTTANPSGFITGVDLTPYQTTAGMTAYQSAGDYISAKGFVQRISNTAGNKFLSFWNEAGGSTATAYPAIYLSGQFGSAYYKDNELKIGRNGHSIAFNIGGQGPKISAAATGNIASFMYVYNTGASATIAQSSFNLSNSTASEDVTIASIQKWNNAVDTVSSNSASWTGGGAGIEYSGISPIVVNNSTHEISADTWDLAIGDGLSAFEDTANNQTVISVTATGGGAGGDVYVSGFEYTTGGDISGYSGSAFVGNDETFELIAGYGISLATGAGSLTVSNTITLSTGSI